MNEVIKEVEENNYSEFLIALLWVIYFIGYTIGCLKRKYKKVSF